tara:strand:+ start:173 stop:541 length:369 start_codon:yes stop_codon:yes gene_type:complete
MRIRTLLTEQVAVAIKGRVGTIDGVDKELHSLRESIGRMTSSMSKLEQRAATLASLHTDGFSLDMTIHKALSLHGGVQVLFEQMGLMGCKDCPVGDDETLGEAAAGMGVTKEVLLSKLQELI